MSEFALSMTPERSPTCWSVHQSYDNLHVEKRLTLIVIRGCKKLSKRPKSIVCCSKLGAKQHAAFGYNTDHSMIPHGFDCKHFQPDNKAGTRILRELEGQDSCWNCLTINRTPLLLVEVIPQ